MSSLLDALGYIGDSLDKPGRAVRGLLAGRPDEAAAILPFSDSMGLTDPSRRTSGRDILSQLGADPGEGLGGDAAGMGIEMALDPLTYLGAGLGARLGTRAGEAAAAAGPRFGTTADDLLRMGAESPLTKTLLGASDLEGGLSSSGGDISRHISDILSNPGSKRILSEIPEESTILGAGGDALTFRTPQGDVLRLGNTSPGNSGRPIAEGVAQPTRTIDLPGHMGASDGIIRAERVPFAEGVGDPTWNRLDPTTMMSRSSELDNVLNNQGLRYMDRHGGNVGMIGGKPTVIDPGAIDARRFTGEFQQPIAAAEPSALMRALIGLGGGDEATRTAIAAGQSGPNFVPRFTLGGAGLGSLLGSSGRL